MDKKLEKIITDLLYDTCDRVHASCDSDCPVFRISGNKLPLNNDCPYHKDGKGMLKYIKSKLKSNEKTT